MSFYRTPADPSRVGRYDWRSTVVGFSLFIAANWVGTQYIARQFAYQPALGLPVYRIHGHSIYQPFSWAVWSWAFRKAMFSDAAVRAPVEYGVRVILGGCLVAFLGMVLTRARQSRKLREGSEDLHGSAKWATREDVEQSGLLAPRPGCCIGGWRDDGWRNCLRSAVPDPLWHNGADHILAFAPTRSGKGVCLVIPTLLVWAESCVIYDIKGENWAKTSGFRSTFGVCFKFAPTELETTRFNPLSEIRIGTVHEVKDVQNIGEMLGKPFGEVVHEQGAHGYFFETAASLLSGAILYCCYEADAEGRVACLGDVLDFLNVRGQEEVEEEEEQTKKTGKKPSLKDVIKAVKEKEKNWHPEILKRMVASDHPFISSMGQEMIEKAVNNWDGVISTARSQLKVYHEPLVRAATSASDFTVDDLVNHNRPVSLYMIVPPSDKERLRPLIRLMLTTIVNRLTEKMRFDGTELAQNRWRLLLMIDEFPSLSSMPLFSSALEYMAGYGIKAFLIAQDIRQIEREYGRDESVSSNCPTRIAFAPNNYETAKLLENMTGRATIARASPSYSGSRWAAMPNHTSVHVAYDERPLLTADEFMRLPAAKKQGEGANERIVAPGAMVIFRSGEKPIMGTQTPYFMYPELLRRSKIRPPHTLLMIAEGEEYQQVDAEYTENVVSRVEPEPQEEEAEGATLQGPIPW